MSFWRATSTGPLKSDLPEGVGLVAFEALDRQGWRRRRSDAAVAAQDIGECADAGQDERRLALLALSVLAAEEGVDLAWPPPVLVTDGQDGLLDG